MMAGVSKRKLAALEKVFGAEIENRLPFQGRGKVYQELCNEGLLENMVRTSGTAPYTVYIYGYQLTHAGRLTYCESCADVAC